jgi:hypothetical protein
VKLDRRRIGTRVVCGDRWWPSVRACAREINMPHSHVLRLIADGRSNELLTFKRHRKIVGLGVVDGVPVSWPSIRAAARHLRVHHSMIASELKLNRRGPMLKLYRKRLAEDAVLAEQQERQQRASEIKKMLEQHASRIPGQPKPKAV